MLEVGPIKLLLKRYVSEHEAAMRMEPETILDKDTEKYLINQCRKALSILEAPMPQKKDNNDDKSKETTHHES